MKFNFPNLIPIFPLSGVVYFPRTNLPLNVFEERYLDLVNDCYKKDKLMGMIQNKRDNDVYSVGCLGKISSLKKNNDGRIFINLTGLTRFEVKKEMKNNKLYREFEVEYKKFSGDLVDENTSMNLGEFDFLLEKTKFFFNKNNLLLNWKEFENLEKDQQINTISMIAPISNGEKQKLLETITLSEKIETLSNIIEFYLHDKTLDKSRLQ
jgi:Lon protease-like protein